MRSKLLIFTIIIAVMLPLFAVPALAAGAKVVDITRPEGNEIVTKEIFSIGGACIYDDTTIEFFYKEKETGDYRSLATTEGDSSFKVGNSKLFGKEVELKYKGDNEIRVIAYTKLTKDNPQREDYTITVTEEKKKSNWFDAAINWFKGKDESN